MNRFLLLVSLLVSMFITSASSVQATSANPEQATAAGTGRIVNEQGRAGEEGKQHPRLVETRSWQAYNYETRQFEIHFAVDYVAGLDHENNPVINTVVFSSYENPYDQWEIDWQASSARLLPIPLTNKRQLQTFANYTLAVINCDWENAHAYDNARTWNPNSPLHIADYAYDYDNPYDGLWHFMLAYVGHGSCGSHAQEPPPPMGMQAPIIEEVDWHADTLFAAYVELMNTAIVGVEFEQHYLDPAPWWGFGQYFEPEDIVGAEDQVSQFVSYTLETLNSCENRFRFDSWPMHFFGEELLGRFCDQ